jgi:hypothetical protein
MHPIQQKIEEIEKESNTGGINRNDPRRCLYGGA